METRPRVFSEYVDRTANEEAVASMGNASSSWPVNPFLDPRRAASAPARKPSEAPWEDVPPLALPRSPYVQSRGGQFKTYSGQNLEDLTAAAAEDDTEMDEDGDADSFVFSMEGLEDDDAQRQSDNAGDPIGLVDDMPLQVKIFDADDDPQTREGRGFSGTSAATTASTEGFDGRERSRSGSMSPIPLTRGESPLLMSVLRGIAAEASASSQSSKNNMA
eukprot:CAMPEP_0178442110 /NCGR_PEP_ID=MMETSP0689_2-20121128/37954_1 /TAXON_ID=160604 /ORGANISM="Amphidinium massartii, Strain CS-259" /LENGTH=218 /DNA_ID=CAMNT_0020065563 /DNA_START=1 /DNA_END=657 /DNA_ORIENTATION=+